MRSRPPELLGLDRLAEDSQVLSELHLAAATGVETLLDTHFSRVRVRMLGTKQLSVRTLVLADFSFFRVCTACPAVKLDAAEFR